MATNLAFKFMEGVYDGFLYIPGLSDAEVLVRYVEVCLVVCVWWEWVVRRVERSGKGGGLR